MAIVAFFGANLFVQIPLSVLQVLFTQESELTQIELELYTPETIEANFTTPGIQLSKVPWLNNTSSKEAG